MKIFVLFSILLLGAYLIGLIKRESIELWMSRSFTTAIKGFSIFTIVWAHTGAQLGVGGFNLLLE